MNKMTWKEATEYMREYNRKHGVKTPGITDKHCVMVAVMKNKGFNRDDYTEEERSYVFNNDNKAFIDGMLGYSIFSANLVDPDIDRPRLERYVEEEGYGGPWEVDYVYIKSED